MFCFGPPALDSKTSITKFNEDFQKSKLIQGNPFNIHALLAQSYKNKKRKNPSMYFGLGVEYVIID